MKVLVTGAGGYIGRFLCKRLLKEGHDVIYLDTASNKIPHEGCEVLLHDLASNEGLKLPPIDAVIYLAQSPFYREMPEKAKHLFDVNICGLIKVAESARRAGANKFIYASTGNVYRQSFDPFSEDSPKRKDDFYALSKLTGEHVLELYSSYYRIIITRLFTIYGPGQANMLVPKIVERVKSNESIFLEPSKNEESDTEGLLLTPCFVEDAVAVFKALLEKECESNIFVNVAGPEIISIKQIALAAAGHLAKEAVFSKAPHFRTGNLIADTLFLQSFISHKFTPFAFGIEKTLFTE